MQVKALYSEIGHYGQSSVTRAEKPVLFLADVAVHCCFTENFSCSNPYQAFFDSAAPQTRESLTPSCQERWPQSVRKPLLPVAWFQCAHLYLVPVKDLKNNSRRSWCNLGDVCFFQFICLTYVALVHNPSFTSVYFPLHCLTVFFF